MPLTWNEELQRFLESRYGPKKGSELSKKYSHSFTVGYSDDYGVEAAGSDIENIEELSPDNPLIITLYASPDPDFPLHLRVFQWQTPIPLSDVLPMLENFNLRTNNEKAHKILLPNEQIIWVSDFAVSYPKTKLNIESVKEVFEEAFIKVFLKLAESDGFNKLVLAATLTWQEVMVLRMYAKYLRQVSFRFSQAYIERALVNNAAITKKLIALFHAKFNPKEALKNKSAVGRITEEIIQSLESVVSLDEDRILRRILDLMNATLRTTYFQTTADHEFKPYLAIKINSQSVPELPLPTPLFEIFVYSTRFEAIHLRHAKVARGGIRWSDRLEDFRTEVLGLMKAQVVKNAVIVPSGAKGGFVLKSTTILDEELRSEVLYCYEAFISALLDLTDNIVNNKFVPPKDVVCYDDPDPYLVVAADKGTATFSDVANKISLAYDFWLNDAFASGGSTGYDHKKMGITARGAWESIKRHFRELDIDVNIATITVVGIGDMSGDVFGNGMIYSDRIKLVGAFDHRHIFIDPNPNPKLSYAERLRLFKLSHSSWEDYNDNLISPGGGVFKRSVKAIPITPEMKEVLNIDEDSLTPNDLIRAMLRAPVDLLFNGGIGTYVKASFQSQTDVGDRSNDYCRVNGDELHCRVVCEGGNLGFTQLGRIEYARKGGLINTDFIDNSGGVDCSDHEVNLKILLDQAIQQKKLTYKKRNELLASLTDEIAELVLSDNYNQALVLSFSAFSARTQLSLHTNYITDLENEGLLKRKVEYLPDDKELLERRAGDEGLTRPEVAVLLAYTKIHIKHRLLKTDLLEDPYLRQYVETAFPPRIRSHYQYAMQDHRLHRDIIATQLSNQIVNEMGITFVYRLEIETGANVDEIVRAHAVASHIFGTRELQDLIESLDFKIPMPEQYEMLYNIRSLINLSTRWFLHSNHLKADLKSLIDHYSVRVKALEELTPTLMAGFTKDYLEKLTDQFIKAGLPKESAKRIATYRAIYTALNIIEVATQHNFDLIKTAKVYFAAGERVNLLWFRDQIAKDSREGHWNVLARLTLRDELDIAQRALTVAIIKNDPKEQSTVKLIEKWMTNNERALQRWNRLLTMLHANPSVEYTMFFIAMRELIGFISAEQSEFMG